METGSAKAIDSSLWKNLAKMWPHMESMTYWELGNGKTTRFWSNAWIELGLHLSLKLHSQNCRIERNLNVCRMVNNKGE